MSYKLILIFILMTFAWSFSTQAASLEPILINLDLEDSSIADSTYIKYAHLSKATWQKNPQQALEYASKMLSYAKETKRADRISRSHRFIGIAYAYLGNYKLAEQNYKTALEIAEEVNYQAGIKHTNNNLGYLYYLMGNYQEALKAHLKSLKIKKVTNDEKGIAYTYNNLALVHAQLKDFENTETYFEKSIQIRQKLGAGTSIIKPYYEYGFYRLDRKDYQKAEMLFRTAHQYCQKFDDEVGLTNVLMGLAEIKLQQASLDSASFFLETSKKLALAQGQDYEIAKLMYLYAKLDYLLGNYDKALAALNESNQHILSTKIVSADLSLDQMRLYPMIYEKLGKFEKAYFYQIKYQALTDSLLNESIRNNIFNFKLKEQEKETEKKLAIKDLTIQQQTNLVIFLGIILILAIALVALFFNRSRLKNQVNKELAKINFQVLAQKEEIVEQANALRIANEEISQMNENLEYIIEIRTQKLESQNDQLTRYAFLNAHKLRAPLATMMGLLYILDYDKSNDLQSYLPHLKKCSHDLNEVIFEIQEVLDKDFHNVNGHKKHFKQKNPKVKPIHQISSIL